MNVRFSILLAVSLAAVLRACVIDDYVKHGDSCSCSVKCLENSHCLKNETGGLSCQCLPCQVYDTQVKQCVDKVDEVVDPDPCSKDPCEQNQICTNLPQGGFECTCKPDYVVSSTDPTKCQVKPCSETNVLDLVFVVDSSGSIGANYYPRNFDFIRNILPAFVISEARTKVALVTFGTSVRYIFNLTSDRDFIYQKLQDVPYQGSTTSTHAGLLAALTILTVDGYGGRDGANKSVVLISDGYSTNRTKTLEAADRVKDAGINIFTLGIKPDADRSELIAIASRPDYFLSVLNYDTLVTHDSNTTDLICHATPPPKPVPPCSVPAILDLHLVVDSSGSIGEENYVKNFIFLERLLRKYYIAANGVKVSFITFGTSVREKFKLSDDKEFIFQGLQNVDYQGSSTSTHLAYRYVLNNLDKPEYGARPGVAAKVIFLITDGRSTKPEETLLASDAVKSAGFVNVVLAVTSSIDKDEILALASKPEYAFFAESYDLLDEFASDASEIFCNEGRPRRR